MISLLVALLVLVVVVYVARLVVAEFGLPPTVVKIVYLVIALLALFYFLDLLGLFTFPVTRLR